MQLASQRIPLQSRRLYDSKVRLPDIISHESKRNSLITYNTHTACTSLYQLCLANEINANPPRSAYCRLIRNRKKVDRARLPRERGIVQSGPRSREIGTRYGYYRCEGGSGCVWHDSSRNAVALSIRAALSTCADAGPRGAVTWRARGHLGTLTHECLWNAILILCNSCREIEGFEHFEIVVRRW